MCWRSIVYIQDQNNVSCKCCNRILSSNVSMKCFRYTMRAAWVKWRIFGEHDYGRTGKYELVVEKKTTQEFDKQNQMILIITQLSWNNRMNFNFVKMKSKKQTNYLCTAPRIISSQKSLIVLYLSWKCTMGIEKKHISIIKLIEFWEYFCYINF